jgi:tetratricopeptide (TPR) repeat protein
VLSLLLVENHLPTREFLAGVLGSAGHRLRLASADEAFELFAAESPDAVLLSLHLPGLPELIARMRAAHAAIPLVAFDRGHLGQALGPAAARPLGVEAYVGDVTQRPLLDQLSDLERQRAPLQAGTASLLAQPPTLQGPLKEGTLAATLVMLLRTFRDGVLVLQQGEVERRLFLRLGVPVSFSSTERTEALDRWLVGVGRITEAQLAESLRERAGGALSTSASLVAAGAIEPGVPLLSALRDHLVAMLTAQVAQRGGRFRFHAGDGFLSEVQPIEVPSLGHLLPGARAGLPLRTFIGALLSERPRFPRRSESFSEQLPQLALSARDLGLALGLDGSRSTAELLSARGGPLRETASLLWFLRLVDAVRFDADRAIAPPGTVRPAEPGLRPLTEAQLVELREGALAVLPSTHFHALGVDIASPPDEVERAYLRRSEQLHPDRFSGHDLEAVEDLLNQVQDKLAAAHRTLSAPEKRAGYLEHLLGKAAGLRGQRELVASAEVAMKEAEKFLAAREPTRAVERARKASQLAPREPDFLAHLAILELLDRSRSDDDRRNAARKAARRALTLDPEHARAQVALGLVARDEGDLGEARRAVLAALKLRPRLELARWLLRELNRVP